MDRFKYWRLRTSSRSKLPITSLILARLSFKSCLVRRNVTISSSCWLTRSCIRRRSLSSTALINDALICSSVIVAVPSCEVFDCYKKTQCIHIFSLVVFHTILLWCRMLSTYTAIEIVISSCRRWIGHIWWISTMCMVRSWLATEIVIWWIAAEIAVRICWESGASWCCWIR